MFWDDLSTADRQAIESIGIRRSFEAGSIIFGEGADSSFALVILRGRLKLTTSTPEGRELLVELRGPGELIGELGAVDDSPRFAMATVVDRLDAITVSSPAFRQLLADRGSVGLAVLKVVADRVRQSGRRRLESGTSDVLARLCGRLVELAATTEPGADGSIDLLAPLTQQEMADWIGVSRDAVVLALRRLREAGLVETGRRRIRIHDLEALRQAASAT